MSAAAVGVPLRLPLTPVSGLTAGVDWAAEDHAVAIVDHSGRETHRFTVASTAQGLTELVRRLMTVGVPEVAIERPDGVVVDALLAAGLTVVVISPNRSKICATGTVRQGTRMIVLTRSSRLTRYGQTG